MTWTAVMAVVAALVALAAFMHWTVRSIVREEVAPLRERITVVETAVFNHLAHGEAAVEAEIRERLGYSHGDCSNRN